MRSVSTSESSRNVLCTTWAVVNCQNSIVTSLVGAIRPKPGITITWSAGRLVSGRETGVSFTGMTVTRKLVEALFDSPSVTVKVRVDDP